MRSAPAGEDIRGGPARADSSVDPATGLPRPPLLWHGHPVIALGERSFVPRGIGPVDRGGNGVAGAAGVVPGTRSASAAG